MPRPHRLWLAAVLAVCAACGCSSTGHVAGPLAWMKKTPAAKADTEPAPFKPAEDKAAKKDDAKAKVASNDKPAADAKKDDKAAPAVAEAKAAEPAKPAEPAKTAAATADAKPAGAVHDAATLALIEEELKQVSPEERAKLYAEFKSLDGEMVRQVIRINKMVRELEAQKTAAAAGPPPGSSALPGTANPWAANAPPATAESRVLPLGGAPPAVPGPPPTGELLAQAAPVIVPAGHSVPVTNGAVQTTAAVGHSTTRPVPVLEAIAGGAAANGPPAYPTGGAPATAPAANDAWSVQLRQLIAAAEARAEQARAGFLGRPQGAAPADEGARRFYVQSQVHLRLLYLMAGEQARAMQAIPGLDPADQEFWQQVLWGMSNYFDDAALPNRADRATQTVEQLRTAVTRLQGEANLQLRNAAFCRNVKSFGFIEKFDRDEYGPGQRVLLYCEIANFKSVVQPADGLYKTLLKTTVEIYRTGQGQPVSKIDFEPTTDLCRSYRQDYFHIYEMTIPSDLTLGPHVLKLTVEDMQTGKLATYNVNFTVK